MCVGHSFVFAHFARACPLLDELWQTIAVCCASARFCGRCRAMYWPLSFINSSHLVEAYKAPLVSALQCGRGREKGRGGNTRRFCEGINTHAHHLKYESDEDGRWDRKRGRKGIGHLGIWGAVCPNLPMLLLTQRRRARDTRVRPRDYMYYHNKWHTVGGRTEHY